MVDRRSINEYRITTNTRANLAYMNSIVKVVYSNGDNLADDDLLGFFTLIPLNLYVDFLNSVSFEKSIQFYEYGGITYGPLIESQFDQIDPIQFDMVRIGVYDKYIDISKRELAVLSLDFAFAVLGGVTWYNLINEGIVDEIWVNQVKNWVLENEVDILKQKMKL